MTNFKNYRQLELGLNQKFNAFVGLNGMGKTNVLDAIYYLSMAKSYFTARDRNIALFDSDFFRIEGRYKFENDSIGVVEAKVQPGKSKEIVYNNKKYQKRSDHIGKIPVVIITPNDMVELMGASEIRRKFLDTTLIQFDKEYLKHLLNYNRLLKQRNALLKQFHENRTWNETLVQVIDDKMEVSAVFIYERRKEESHAILPFFEKIYSEISQDAETCALKYKSSLDTTEWKALQHSSRQHDKILKRTTAGIHKDDLVFLIKGKKIKNFGSQGQLKSFVFSLKLAQYHFIKNKKQIKPLLLLDDIFDKLDGNRVEALIKIIAKDDYGQIFITHTSESRIKSIFDSLNLSNNVFQIKEGKLAEE